MSLSQKYGEVSGRDILITAMGRTIVNGQGNAKYGIFPPNCSLSSIFNLFKDNYLGRDTRYIISRILTIRRCLLDTLSHSNKDVFVIPYSGLKKFIYEGKKLNGKSYLIIKDAKSYPHYIVESEFTDYYKDVYKHLKLIIESGIKREALEADFFKELEEFFSYMGKDPETEKSKLVQQKEIFDAKLLTYFVELSIRFSEEFGYTNENNKFEEYFDLDKLKFVNPEYDTVINNSKNAFNLRKLLYTTPKEDRVYENIIETVSFGGELLVQLAEDRHTVYITRLNKEDNENDNNLKYNANVVSNIAKNYRKKDKENLEYEPSLDNMGSAKKFLKEIDIVNRVHKIKFREEVNALIKNKYTDDAFICIGDYVFDMRTLFTKEKIIAMSYTDKEDNHALTPKSISAETLTFGSDIIYIEHHSFDLIEGKKDDYFIVRKYMRESINKSCSLFHGIYTIINPVFFSGEIVEEEMPKEGLTYVQAFEAKNTLSEYNWARNIVDINIMRNSATTNGLVKEVSTIILSLRSEIQSQTLVKALPKEAGIHSERGLLVFSKMFIKEYEKDTPNKVVDAKDLTRLVFSVNPTLKYIQNIIEYNNDRNPYPSHLGLITYTTEKNIKIFGVDYYKSLVDERDRLLGYTRKKLEKTVYLPAEEDYKFITAEKIKRVFSKKVHLNLADNEDVYSIYSLRSFYDVLATEYDRDTKKVTVNDLNDNKLVEAHGLNYGGNEYKFDKMVFAARDKLEEMSAEIFEEDTDLERLYLYVSDFFYSEERDLFIMVVKPYKNNKSLKNDEESKELILDRHEDETVCNTRMIVVSTLQDKKSNGSLIPVDSNDPDNIYHAAITPAAHNVKLYDFIHDLSKLEEGKVGSQLTALYYISDKDTPLSTHQVYEFDNKGLFLFGAFSHNWGVRQYGVNIYDYNLTDDDEKGFSFAYQQECLNPHYIDIYNKKAIVEKGEIGPHDFHIEYVNNFNVIKHGLLNSVNSYIYTTDYEKTDKIKGHLKTNKILKNNRYLNENNMLNSHVTYYKKDEDTGLMKKYSMYDDEIESDLGISSKKLSEFNDYYSYKFGKVNSTYNDVKTLRIYPNKKGDIINIVTHNAWEIMNFFEGILTNRAEKNHYAQLIRYNKYIWKYLLGEELGGPSPIRSNIIPHKTIAYYEKIIELDDTDENYFYASNRIGNLTDIVNKKSAFFNTFTDIFERFSRRVVASYVNDFNLYGEVNHSELIPKSEIINTYFENLNVYLKTLKEENNFDEYMMKTTNTNIITDCLAEHITNGDNFDEEPKDKIDLGNTTKKIDMAIKSYDKTIRLDIANKTLFNAYRYFSADPAYLFANRMPLSPIYNPHQNMFIFSHSYEEDNNPITKNPMLVYLHSTLPKLKNSGMLINWFVTLMKYSEIDHLKCIKESDYNKDIYTDLNSTFDDKFKVLTYASRRDLNDMPKKELKAMREIKGEKVKKEALNNKTETIINSIYN